MVLISLTALLNNSGFSTFKLIATGEDGSKRCNRFIFVCSFSISTLQIFFNNIITRIIPNTPKGYATAYAKPTEEGLRPLLANCISAMVCWAAPRPGVLVTAPDIIPVIIPILLPDKYRK